MSAQIRLTDWQLAEFRRLVAEALPSSGERYTHVASSHGDACEWIGSAIALIEQIVKDAERSSGVRS